MKTLAALVSGLGWHVGDLERAARRLDVALHLLPFAQVAASVAVDDAGNIFGGYTNTLNLRRWAPKNPPRS